MLVYRLPRAKTTARKVALWRKLKKLGVYFVQDSTCILPYSERTLEIFEWLAAEVREGDGDASVWKAEVLTPERDRIIRAYFLEQVNVEYRAIIRESILAANEEDLRTIWARYNRVRARDYLKSPLAVEAGAACEKRAREFVGKEKAI